MGSAMYNKIKELRKKAGLSQDQLAKMVGYTSRSTINKIEKGLIDLPQSKIAELASALNTTPVHLMGYDDDIKELPIENKTFVSFKYSSDVTNLASDKQAKEKLDKEAFIPAKFEHLKNKLRAFKVSGDSMDRIFRDGSIIIVKKENNFNKIKDGDIIAAFFNEYLTIKRVYFYEDYIILSPDSNNKNHKPIVSTIKDTKLRIVGRVIWHINPDNQELYY